MTPMRLLAAEGLGSLLLAATVVGSGIMAERLAGGNAAVALIANTGATVAVLGALITVLAPVSGAHFNPAVSIVKAMRHELTAAKCCGYVIAQIGGCCLGATLANRMFELPLVDWSMKARGGAGQWIGEFVATFGLLLVVLGHPRDRAPAWTVAAWIGAAYWFTSSTSFANPAITIARSLSDTFAGIRPADVPAFVVAQFAGAAAAFGVSRSLFGTRANAET